MKKNLSAQLKMLSVLRDDPRFGARSAEFVAAEKAKIMAAIGHDASASAKRYTLADYLVYYRETMFPRAMRMATGIAAGVAFMLGGWLTTVDAAAKSLPGDALYGFKLITEQAQLRMASLERRAVLHTEFAGRRLEEAVALQRDDATDEASVKVALDAFTQEMTSANEDLQALRDAGSPEAAVTAGVIEDKLTTLDTVLDESAATAATPFASSTVQEAKEASRETQSTAVAVVVDNHEATETEQSRIAMQEMFLRDLGDLRARQAFALHRLEVLRNTIDSDDPRLAAVTLPTSEELGALEKSVKEAEGQLDEAFAQYTSDEYRGAFDLLHAIDGTLGENEFRIARAEIDITQAFTQPQSPEPSTDDDATPSP